MGLADAPRRTRGVPVESRGSISAHVGRALAAASVGAAILLSGCEDATVVDLPATVSAPLSSPDDVDAVLFLLGDGGATETGRSPVLARLGHDIERWSAALARDSAVSVLFPGDIVYPVGVRDRRHPEFSRDTARLWNQVRLVAGPKAREHASLGLFLAGNHDWGSAMGDEGLQRLVNLDEALQAARERGPHVALFPDPGHPGPVIRDLRRNVRLVLLDTHWFLQTRREEEKDAFFERVAEALMTAGDRHVIMVQHHPYASAGPHGALLPGFAGLGLPYLLKKTGTLVQDLDSRIYGEFKRRLRETFRETGKPPLVFAAGHDHSLQVLSGEVEVDPAHILVSGAGSKLTRITQVDGMRFGASRPGYMYLVFREDDAVDLFVVAGAPEHLSCGGLTATDARVEDCMRAGRDSLRVRFSMTLVTPEGETTPPVADSLARPTPWWSPATGDTLVRED